MNNLSKSVQFFLELSKAYTLINRRFDGALNGVSFTEFFVLLSLEDAPDRRLRRVDLAEKTGLTPSAVTRLLLPMEKVGFVKKEVNKKDARSSYVTIASGGRKKLRETLDRATEFCGDVMPQDTPHLDDAIELFRKVR